MKHYFSIVGLTLLLAITTGCMNTRPQPPVVQAPVAFVQPPNLDALIAFVNSNTQRVQSMEAQGASLSMQGYPSIRASISMAPPKSFRLIGETSFTGQLIDMGSNDQEFWAWSKIGNWPGQLYARHDQFQLTAARQMLPIEPSWISQALGLAYFDPNDQHQGPFPTTDGNYEIRSTVNRPSGQLTKVTVIHRTYGWVLQQHVYDASGQTLASAMASEHRYDPAAAVSLPHHVQINLPPAAMQFSVTVYGYRYNHLSAQDNRWLRPQRSDTPSIDLANPNLNLNQLQPVQTQQPNYPAPGFSKLNNPQPFARQTQYDPPPIRGFEGRR